MTPDLIEKIKFDASGLVPAVLQDHFTGKVLMVGYMNRTSLEKTVETGHCWFYSRSRKELWEKGATSGNYQRVQDMQLDCDGDVILVQVKPEGPACHTGRVSCFDGDEVTQSSATVFFEMVDQLSQILRDRNLKRPAGSYSTKLFEAGIREIAKKVGEEGVELAIAAVDEEDDRFTEEAADLFYHLLVLLEKRGISIIKVGEVLQQRHAAKAK